MKLDIRKYIRCLLFVLPFLLSSCNQEDDINEIFVSGQWQLVNYYTGIDWNNYNANAKPTYLLLRQGFPAFLSANSALFTSISAV